MNKRILAYIAIVVSTAIFCFGASQMQLINTTAPGDSLKVGGGKMNTNSLILETNIITMSIGCCWVFYARKDGKTYRLRDGHGPDYKEGVDNWWEEIEL